MPDLLALQPYKIVITRFFFLVLYFKLLRNIYGTYDKILGMCAFINNKNCSYKPGKSFTTQNHLLILWGKKHREKVRNTGKTQGKHREFCLGWNVATLITNVRLISRSIWKNGQILWPIVSMLIAWLIYPNHFEITFCILPYIYAC